MTEPGASAPGNTTPPARPAPAPVSLRARARRFPGTFTLIGVTVAVFAAQWLSTGIFGADVVLAFGAKDKAAIQAGEWWRLVSPIFIHVGLWHLFVNMYSLYILGPPVERFFGTARTVAFYLLTGVGGVISSLVFTRAPSVGASGAIFGLLGALTAFLFLHRSTFGRRGAVQLRQLVLVALLNLGIGVIPGIDNWGHLGGLAAGVALAWALGPRYEPVLAELAAPRLVDRRPWREVRVGVLVAAAVILSLAIVASVR